MIADPLFMRQLEQLGKVARRVGRGARGEHRSRSRGPGLELADHRGYAAGDDPRRLDWNAFARLERPLVRLFHADEALPTYILLDASASMLLGQPPKREQAMRLAAAIAYLGMVALDPVTILAYNTRLDRTVEARGGDRQVASVLSQLSGLVAAGETDLGAAVSAFLSRQRPRGLVVVISDLLGTGSSERALLRLRHARHLTTVVQVTSAEDRQGPELTGLDEEDEMVARDVESGLQTTIALNADARRRYQAGVMNRLEAMARFCRRHGISYLGAAAEQPFEEIIRRLLRAGALSA